MSGGGYFADSSTESDTPVKVEVRPKRTPVRRQSKRLKAEPKPKIKQESELIDLSENDSQSESEDSYKASDAESVSTDETDASVQDFTKDEPLEDEMQSAAGEAQAVEAEEAEPDARPAKRKAKAKAKPRKRTAEEQSQARQKYFDKMDTELKTQHPELVSVFDDLAEIGTRVPTEREQPPGLLCRLLPFQREGLDWLIKQEQSPYHGGILADEMGMGKTIQTIALFLSDGQREGPILVIAPTVAVMQWKNEILQYAGPNVKVLVYHGQNRSNDARVIAENDVVMTTYAVLESCWRKQRSGFTRKGRKVYEKSVLHNMYFHRIVLDEAHNIKDRHASTTVAVFHLQAKYRLCLSGTPLQNRIGELYSLLRFLQIEPFCQYFCTKCDCKSNEWNVKGQRCTVCNHVAMQHVNFFNHSLLKHILKLKGQQDMAISRMRLLLNTLMLRRTKVERADDLGLPPRIVNVRRDYFNEEEKDLYNSVFSDSSRTFSTYVNQGVVLNNYANIFTLITRMRQIADHPDLVLRKATVNGEANIEAHVCRLCDDEAEDPIKSRCQHVFCRMCIREYVEGWTGEESELECPVCHIKLAIDLEQVALEVDQEVMAKGSIVNRIRMDDSWRSSTKIEALLEELFKLRSDRCTIKSIVFSQFTSVLDLVEWRLARAGFKSVKLQGSMSPSQRDGIIRYFMETTSVEVFLVSLKAGGVALNLCEASQVFLMDPWWNPSVEWQSGDRVHRIGQHRPVTITRLIIEDSIESKILELQEKKANMINATIGSDDAALNRLTQGDMEFLFQN